MSDHDYRSKRRKRIAEGWETAERPMLPARELWVWQSLDELEHRAHVEHCDLDHAPLIAVGYDVPAQNGGGFLFRTRFSVWIRQQIAPVWFDSTRIVFSKSRQMGLTSLWLEQLERMAKGET